MNGRGFLESWADVFPAKNLDALAFQIYAIRIGNHLGRQQDVDCRARFGLTSAQVRPLVALLRREAQGSTSPTELYRSLLITPGAITKQIDHLAEKKLVERMPHPTDGREVIIRLTAEGRHVAVAAIEGRIDDPDIQAALATLTPEESRTLNASLGKILAALERQGSEAGG